jgi:hypothetical protein
MPDDDAQGDRAQERAYGVYSQTLFAFGEPDTPGWE